MTRIALVVLLGWLLPLGVSWAQDTTPPATVQPAIGFVHLSKIFNESTYVARMRDTINDEFAPREANLKEKAEQLTKLRDEQTRNRLTTTAATTATDADRIAELDREIKREDRDIAAAKRARFDEANAHVERTIKDTIEEVAAEAKVYLVFELSAVLFAETRLDLTNAVITALDAKPLPQTTPTAAE